MADPYLIGIDLGGTKIAAAAFSMQGARLGKIARLPTMASLHRAVTLTNLKRVVKQARMEAGVTGKPQAIGMGSTGPLDPKNRVLHDRDSLPQLVGFSIGRFCRAEFGAPLHLENDAGCFALGEAVQGAGRHGDVVLGITLGTGFGCGISVRKTIYSGSTHNAGEVAYCPLGDSDFDHACSGAGVVRRYRQQAGAVANEGLTAKEIGKLAVEGDTVALRAWGEFGRDVGTAIGTICCVIDPSVVVLGGSVSQRFALFEERLRDAAREVLPGTSRDRFNVVVSELGNSAGVVGAAEHARQQFGS